MSEYTIIPDIHADPLRLRASVDAAEGRNIAFLGDFIDAGKAVLNPDDTAVLKHVRSLIDAGLAMAVMGNHELNAILFHRNDRRGAPLRKHSSRNVAQHASFLDQIGLGTPAAVHWTEWFLSLPLWIELDGLRLVHACWDQAAIDIVSERRPDGRLHPEDLEEVAENKTPFAKAVESLTSGPEVQLPGEHDGFYDVKGDWRRHVRLAWWRAQEGTWRELALAVPDVDQLPDTPIVGAEGITIYANGQTPVLVGHYKMKGLPRIDASQAACLDYPERYCVYHWAGEAELSKTNLRSCALVGDASWA